MNKVNQILAMRGSTSPANADEDITSNEDPSLTLEIPIDTDFPVKGRNIPKQVKPQAYCHPSVAKAHKGVSPTKEKKINKNKTRRKHKD